MEVFLPIAQVSISAIEILLLSGIVGVLSGLFGVGGGFLMTPFLIFLGVPPAYAVANEANNILATSVSGSTTHYLKNTLDYKMGFMIVIAGTNINAPPIPMMAAIKPTIKPIMIGVNALSYNFDF